MAIQIFQVQETPAAPRVEAVRSITYGYIDIEIAAGGDAYIYKGTDIFCTSEDWCIGARDELAFQIYAGSALGAVLEVELSQDGLVFDFYHAFALGGLNPEFVTGFVLPGYMARFRLYNNDGLAVQGVTGLIMLRGQ